MDFIQSQLFRTDTNSVGEKLMQTKPKSNAGFRNKSKGLYIYETAKSYGFSFE